MSIPTHMRALEVTSLTGPEAIRVVERPVPQPRADEALICVKAAGVNFADTMQARGRHPLGPPAPYVAGLEACGEIVAVGPDGSSDLVGSPVIGIGLGAFAEYLALPVATLQPLPEGWTPVQGASFFAAWVTAYGCLRTLGRLAQGESVLIHAAAGSVGQVAVRLAKHFGARVFATASTAEKLAIARRLGADECINYAVRDFATEVKERTNGRGVDLILEMVGGETFRKNLEAVMPYGRIVVFGIASGHRATIDNFELMFRYPIELIGFDIAVLPAQRPDLFGPMVAEMNALVTVGVAQPEEPAIYALADGPQVLADLERRKTTGKMVLVP